MTKYGRLLRFYVPTHSLINYSQWKIVSPESALIDLPTVDGYIAQIWTGTSREPNVFRGVRKERTFETAFDEEYARASGTRSGLADTLSAAVVAIVIVVSMRLVGALLVSALLVFPAVSAMRLCKSYRAVTLAAALLGTLGALVGILASILAATPVGPTIVAVNLLLFAACSLAVCIRR